MADTRLWFGTRSYMQYVPQPAYNADFSKVGWSAESQYKSGRAGVRTSLASHKVYNMSWNLASRDALRPITDYADGVYGEELIYFLDPMTMDKNVLPQHWAFPASACSDAPPLIKNQIPVQVATPANGLAYPVKSAQYTVAGSSEKVYIPIPPGYVAWVGVHGSATGSAAVTVTPDGGAASNVALLSVTSTTRVNKQITGTGFELSLTGTGTLTLSGLVVQVLLSGVTPDVGGFISGQGHSGCKFASQPVQTAYSAALDKVGMTAKLVEVDSWE